MQLLKALLRPHQRAQARRADIIDFAHVNEDSAVSIAQHVIHRGEQVIRAFVIQSALHPHLKHAASNLSYDFHILSSSVGFPASDDCTPDATCPIRSELPVRSGTVPGTAVQPAASRGN